MGSSMQIKFLATCLIFALTLTKGDSSSISFRGDNKMKNKRVLISGAGISGLTTAYWLKQYGFEPTVVERHPLLRTGGYKIDIRGAAIEVIKKMGAYPVVLEGITEIQGATIIDSSGKPATELTADLCGGRVEGDIEIMRGDLCEILFKHIGEIDSLFGDYITQITQKEEGVYVEFAQNEPRMFDLVIGADGLHSAVRKLVFGEESYFLKELGMYIAVYRVPNFLNLDRREIEYFEAQKFVNVYSSRGDVDATVGFAFASEQQKLLEEAFTNVGWEIPRFLAAMKGVPDFYFDSAAQIRMPHWWEGRVALVGDAGYAPSPLSGQGTSVAIVGGYVLAGELAKAEGDPTLAFTEYEKELRRFVKKNQELVKMNVALMAEKDTWIAWLHRQLMELLPGSWLELLKKWGTKRIHEAANDLELKNYP
jgi:2-polyprenyl-6-methoxyphenol hydroxylase-like FAD-dependent oxidoreductase